jgi:LemA protein
MPFLLLTAVVVVVLAVLAVGAYNALVRLRNGFQAAFAQIDTELKRRYDLIPNLVETAKGYLKHERETLEAVVAARQQAVGAAQAAARQPGDPAAMAQLASAETALSGVLGRLFALAEAYPDLKASSNMIEVSRGLSDTENRIAGTRQAFNEAVRQYNTARETFPTSILAGMFGFQPAALFELKDEVQREAPKVKFT